jgi:SNF2 family DNA or RNA helicase
VELGEEQRAIYEGIRLAMHERVRNAIAERGLARSGIIILDALLKMRQACCDPRLLKMASAKKAGSAKLDRLMELLEALLGEGRRVLVFSQFTSMLALIEARLKQAGTPYVLLTGHTVDRSTPVRRFQASAVPVFLISLKAGGVGLNPYRRRHGDPLRPLVEPGGGGPGDRPCAPHRPGSARLRAYPGRACRQVMMASAKWSCAR